jgi:hypothetical protein
MFKSWQMYDVVWVCPECRAMPKESAKSAKKKKPSQGVAGAKSAKKGKAAAGAGAAKRGRGRPRKYPRVEGDSEPNSEDAAQADAGMAEGSGEDGAAAEGVDGTQGADGTAPENAGQSGRLPPRQARPRSFANAGKSARSSQARLARRNASPLEAKAKIQSTILAEHERQIKSQLFNTVSLIGRAA